MVLDVGELRSEEMERGRLDRGSGSWSSIHLGMRRGEGTNFLSDCGISYKSKRRKKSQREIGDAICLGREWATRRIPRPVLLHTPNLSTHSLLESIEPISLIRTLK